VTRRLTPAVAVLVALFVAAAVLIAVEFAKGAAHAGSVQLANPCVSRPFSGDVVQRVVLDGLDGAACRLHVSREELVLSLDANSPFHRHWDKKTIEVALRASLLRSVDEAERRGDIPGILAGPIRKLIETAPIDKLIAGGISLSDLFG
jgi:hypothetical protein